MVKASTDICEKKGVLGAGYIPKFALDRRERQLARACSRYFRYAEASFILTCRTPDQTGSGWAGTTGVKDIKQHRRRDADRGRGRQGAEVAQADARSSPATTP